MKFLATILATLALTNGMKLEQQSAATSTSWADALLGEQDELVECLSNDQINGIVAGIFEHVDTNEDGKISMKEARKAGAPRKEARKILRFMDCNGDKQVSKKELR